MEKLIQIKSNNLSPKKGRVLIAEPLTGDFYFGRAVLLLIEHSNEGSFGLVMNKPSGAKLSSLVATLPDLDVMVFVGGPVRMDTLFFIHTLGDKIPLSSEIIPGLYWGGDIEAVHEFITLGLINNKNIRFFLGYSGWTKNQIDDELKRNAWVVSDANMKSLLHINPTKMWDHFLQQLGPQYDLWRGFPVEPEMN